MNRLLKRSLPAVFWLLAWALAARWVGLDLLLPGPLAVGARLAALAATGGFWLSVGATLGRVFLGLAWGALAGAALAFATHFSPWADRLLSPAIRVVRAAPVASFILLVLLWTGRNNVPAVISALMVMPVVWDHLARGIQAVDQKLLELARVCRFSRWKTVRLLYLPSLGPYILSALTTATGLAWKSGVAAEVLCLPEPSLGQRIYYTKYYLDIPELFAWTAVTVALSMVLERILRTCLARWGRGWGA